jgi:2-aminoadipate transaminase
MSMNVSRPANWEEEILTKGLSERARLAGAAYTGPGSGGDLPPRPPIGLTGGIPDPVCLPIDDLIAASERVLREDGPEALQYGGAQGFKGLREWLADHWSRIDRLPLTPDNFTLTNGSAHALENVCETFLNPDDTVIVEGPSFPGSIRAIRSLGAKVVSVPVDADGLVVDALEEVLADRAARGERVKLLYTIPTYHNPTGATMTAGRRHRILDVCERNDVLVVEDDAYGEIGFEMEPPASLYSLSQGRGVIKIGTFSKILATGLRVGWCQATPPIIEALLATRFDMGISPYLLRLIATYAQDGRLDRHIGEVREVYKRKRDLMLNELRERAANLCSWNEPAGGFFLWLRLNERVDPLLLAQAAQEEGVAYVGGRGFFADLTAAEGARRVWGGDSSFIRLAYSFVAEEQIPEGIRRLSRALERATRG